MSIYNFYAIIDFTLQGYHFQLTFLYSHQNNANRGGALVSDDESDEGEEGDYTVYECPGLATVSTYLTPVMINLKRDVFTMFYILTFIRHLEMY